MSQFNLLNLFADNPCERVELALQAMRDGKGVLVVDDENRENEGDIIFAAEKMTEAQMAMMIRYCSGIVCLCMPEEKMKQLPEKRRIVSFEISDERNALERVLLHFAHFEKEAERIGDERYKVSLHYDKEDESEIVIRILSFGPMIKVIEPESFINQIKKRLLRQKSCEL